MTQKTPGTWNIIPKGAVVTATWGEQTITGTLESVTGEYREKSMTLNVPPFGHLKLDARDGWEVTYESNTAGDVIRSAPIGTVLMTTKTRIISDHTVEEYREKFTEDAMRQLLELADAESHDRIVMREVPKIREALGQETLTTAEIREAYAWGYARARDPYPYEADIQEGRDEFNAWFAAERKNW